MTSLELKKATRSAMTTIAVLALAVMPISASAQEAGDDIQTVYGFLSSVPNTGESERFISLNTPVQGRDYEIKIYFLKVETSAALIDDYYDGLSEAARKRGEESGSFVWDKIRDQAQRMESEARYEVFDARGDLIGKVDDIGLLPLFKNVNFRGDSPSYRVKVECLKGAGLFRLVFEYD